MFELCSLHAHNFFVRRLVQCWRNWSQRLHFYNLFSCFRRQDPLLILKIFLFEEEFEQPSLVHLEVALGYWLVSLGLLFWWLAAASGFLSMYHSCFDGGLQLTAFSRHPCCSDGWLQLTAFSRQPCCSDNWLQLTAFSRHPCCSDGWLQLTAFCS